MTCRPHKLWLFLPEMKISEKYASGPERILNKKGFQPIVDFYVTATGSDTNRSEKDKLAANHF